MNNVSVVIAIFITAHTPQILSDIARPFPSRNAIAVVFRSRGRAAMSVRRSDGTRFGPKWAHESRIGIWKVRLFAKRSRWRGFLQSRRVAGSLERGEGLAIGHAASSVWLFWGGISEKGNGGAACWRHLTLAEGFCSFGTVRFVCAQYESDSY